MTVEGGEFNQNNADYGGAIYCNSILNVENSEFMENAADYGGAILAIGVNTRNYKDGFTDPN